MFEEEGSKKWEFWVRVEEYMNIERFERDKRVSKSVRQLCNLNKKRDQGKRKDIK